jgi:glycosyltransferase involved in cell wall biosynthesis
LFNLTAMRILLVHNTYQHRGGEDSVVEAEIELLAARGNQVRLFGRHNDDIAGIGRASLALQTQWSRASARALSGEIASWGPDVVHVHNTFPLISPSAYWACAVARVPVVQTLHNFRLLCPQAMFLRDSKVCEDCQGKLPWRAALHGCYRDSRAQSSVLAGMLILHRALGTWRNKVTRYIALNEFCRRKFIEGGLPAQRIVVKPNFVDCAAPLECKRQDFLFVGRLSAEKGIECLALSAKLAGVRLRVAGTGPEEARLRDVPGAVVLGSLNSNAVYEEMERAQALVMPSIWYENFPRTLVEALAHGLPVIASRLGALPDLVQDGVTGLLFEPGNAQDLAAKLRWAQEHPGEMAVMGRNARARYEALYTAERNYTQLMAIYLGAIDEVEASGATVA